MRANKGSQLRACNRGAALIEFAFVFPVVALLMFGAIEISRYILITQKVERAGYMVGDTLSQTEPQALTLASIDTLFQQYYTMMRPYGSTDKQGIILTSVTKDPADNKVKINWQYAGGGTLTNSKTVSIVNNMSIATVGTVPAGTPASYTKLNDMVATENMIVAEVFFQYSPILSNILPGVSLNRLNLGPRTLIRRTYFHPRNGDLDHIVSTKTCALPWGGAIADGAYVTAWQSTTAVPCPGCISQVRVCTNGVLSGSYPNQNCDLNWSGTTTKVCESALNDTQNTCESGGGTFQRGPASGSCGAEDNLLYACCGATPPPTNCAAGTANWNGAVSGCSAPYGALTNGDSATLTNTVSGKGGSVTVQCSGGSIIQSGATCAAATSCPAATVSWADILSCSKATTAMLASGASQSLTINTKFLSGYCNARCNNGSLACDAGYTCEEGYGSSSSCSTC